MYINFVSALAHSESTSIERSMKSFPIRIKFTRTCRRIHIHFICFFVVVAFFAMCGLCVPCVCPVCVCVCLGSQLLFYVCGMTSGLPVDTSFNISLLRIVTTFLNLSLYD